MVDDTLFLNFKKGKAQGADIVPMSVSRLKLYKDDPYLFYLSYVEGHRQEATSALAFGASGHAAMEHFLASQDTDASMEAFERALTQELLQIKNPTYRINLKDPRNPRNKETVAAPLETLLDLGYNALYPVLEAMRLGISDSPFLAAQTRVKDIEITLGELADRNGFPTTEMVVRNQLTGKFEPGKVAEIAGIGMHGLVDAVCEWEDGSDIIIDHKFVTNCVSYYPPFRGNGPWQMYEPSYNPADDIQLDVYSYATGIMRAGFQFVTKFPQYVPPSGLVYPDWLPWEEWSRSSNRKALPSTVLNNHLDQAQYIGVWRPAEGDHDTLTGYTRQAIMGRTVSTIRSVVESITEGIILLQSGVDPIIAFPGGDPDEIARKSCPFCSFGSNGSSICRAERKPDEESKEAYLFALETREELCLSNADIMERRGVWKNAKTHTII